MFRLSRIAFRSFPKLHVHPRQFSVHNRSTYGLNKIYPERLESMKKVLAGPGQTISLGYRQQYTEVNVLDETEFKSVGFSFNLYHVDVECDQIKSFFPHMRKFVEYHKKSASENIISAKKPKEPESLPENVIIEDFDTGMGQIRHLSETLSRLLREFHSEIGKMHEKPFNRQIWASGSSEHEIKLNLTTLYDFLNNICYKLIDMIRYQQMFEDSLLKINRFNKEFLLNFNMEKLMANYTEILNITRIDMTDVMQTVSDDLKAVHSYLQESPETRNQEFPTNIIHKWRTCINSIKP